MAKKKKDESQPGFEQRMAKLEEIASELEAGELPLEQAIERYEEGVTCYKECHRILAGAEKKVEILTKSADGSLEGEPFEEDEEKSSADEGDDADDDGDGEPDEAGDRKRGKPDTGGTLPF